MEQLLDYTLGEMSTERAGTCKWCFGVKDGREYFIKEFLSPKYPYQDTVLSPEKIQDRKRKCREFAARKLKIYEVVNKWSDGNGVRICRYFRHKQKFYLSMQKIDELPWTIETIYSMEEEVKRYLCSIICHGVAALHRGHLVHADLKHENILFTHAANGNITAKLIDFDSAFLESEPPSHEEISGDWVYFSPEFWARQMEIEAPLTCKMDVFALGVLFHQYFTNELPGFPTDTGASSVGQAVLQGLPVTLSDRLPPDLAELFGRMLRLDPKERPTAFEVFKAMQPARLREYLEANNVRDRLEEKPRYCTRCGTVFYGEGKLCPACSAKANVAREPSSAGGVGFYTPGNL